MIAGKNVLAFVMAGGEGSRLHPLTAERSKPSVPFNGKHRIVDFVLSNLVNSEIYSVYLLVQYKSQSLIEHVRKSWVMTPFLPHQFITVVPPQMHHGAAWFQGTADAVCQNIHLINLVKPDLVAVFGADHVYRMDVRQMVQHHVDTQAHVSVAALPVPVSQCDQFGIIRTNSDTRITAFEEKPRTADSMPGRPGFTLASMGNYIFSTDVLLDALNEAHSKGENDFGKHILPRLTKTHKVVAYDFATNKVPGVQEYEEAGYWRDVGTIDAYFAANFDTIGERPRFRMTNPQWPIYASPDQVEAAQIIDGQLRNSSIGAGCVLRGARINGALLRREVVVEEDAEITESIIMDRTVIGRGAKVRRAIIDQNNIVRPGDRIGFDPARDRERGFHVSEQGIVVVGRGQLR
ncbi:glucose-1-phosphate adenylyltransferase [Uliginosibacterium sp. H1]|uniref:glucose-1-phosphate adenylyltransferase n=1 Tax=Uliginosibacterium sp. H1 TaxID=3114757 RepID=UPI002E19057C|nr:glucose-1-phosphate adenylyltransferase [Uliginosibacterium sp. H1]